MPRQAWPGTGMLLAKSLNGYGKFSLLETSGYANHYWDRGSKNA